MRNILFAATKWALISALYFYFSIAIAVTVVSYRAASIFGLGDTGTALKNGLTWPLWIGSYL